MKAVLAAEAGKADETKVDAWLQLTNLANEGSHFDVAAERLQQASAALARLGTKWDLKVRVLASEALLAFAHRTTTTRRSPSRTQARVTSPTSTPTRRATRTRCSSRRSILNAAGHAAEALDDFRKVLAYHEVARPPPHRSRDDAPDHGVGRARRSGAPTTRSSTSRPRSTSTNRSMATTTSRSRARTAPSRAVQSTKGDLAGALATDQRALALVARTLGENTDLYAMILGQLAGTLVDLGRHKEAIPYLDRALAIQTAKLGPGHVQTLTIMLTKCDALARRRRRWPRRSTCAGARSPRPRSRSATTVRCCSLFVGAHRHGASSTPGTVREASAMFERALALGANDPARTSTRRDARRARAVGHRRSRAPSSSPERRAMASRTSATRSAIRCATPTTGSASIGCDVRNPVRAEPADVRS